MVRKIQNQSRDSLVSYLQRLHIQVLHNRDRKRLWQKLILLKLSSWYPSQKEVTLKYPSSFKIVITISSAYHQDLNCHWLCYWDSCENVKHGHDEFCQSFFILSHTHFQIYVWQGYFKKNEEITKWTHL